jgi:2-amino-4-hydroxy-6-hydroxymethyldihydropteridine diphosphokinase
MAKKKIMENIGSIIKFSSIYETAPWGFESEQNFLNQVLIVSTKLTPIKLLHQCLEIETDLGRIRQTGNYTSRTMDVDILFFNEEIVRTKQIVIPHERLHLRRFTLKPLVEIAPDFIHPVFKKSLSLLLQECEDHSEVIKL